MKKRIATLINITIIALLFQVGWAGAEECRPLDGNLRPLAYFDREASVATLDIPWRGWAQHHNGLIGSVGGMEDFRGFPAVFEKLQTATSCVDRVLALVDGPGLSRRQVSILAGGYEQYIEKMIQDAREKILPARIPALSTVLCVDPLFLLTGTGDLEKACQELSQVGRIRLAMSIGGLTWEALAERMGVSLDNVKTFLIDGSPLSHGMFLDIAKALNKGSKNQRWSAVLLEFGFQPPVCGLFNGPAVNPGFSSANKGYQKKLDRADELADQIVREWRTDPRKYDPIDVGRWAEQIRPLKRPNQRSGKGKMVPSVVGALVVANSGALDQAIHYGYITVEMKPYLLTGAPMPPMMVKNLAERLAVAHHELRELFILESKFSQSAEVRLEPPKGYPDAEAARAIDDGAWYLLSRLVSRPRLLALLENCPWEYRIFKVKIFAARDPEDAIEVSKKCIDQLVAEEVNQHADRPFSPGFIANRFFASSISTVRPMLKRIRELTPLMLQYAERGWVVSQSKTKEQITVQHFIEQVQLDSIPKFEGRVAIIRNRSAAFKRALVRSPDCALVTNIAGIVGLNPSPEITGIGMEHVACVHDLANRAYAFLQFLAPQHPFVRVLDAAPDAADETTEYLSRASGPADFLMAFSDHLPSGTASVTDIDAFARSIAKSIIEVTGTMTLDATLTSGYRARIDREV
ncbi:MAG: hypothetical protein WCG78_05125 [Candidatus Omnitrophota bacterium]